MIKLNIKYKLTIKNFLFFCILMRAYADGSPTTIVNNKTTTLTVAECKNDIIQDFDIHNASTIDKDLHPLVIAVLKYSKFQMITKPHVKEYYKEIESTIVPDKEMLDFYKHCSQTVKKEEEDHEFSKSFLTKGKEGFFNCLTCVRPHALEENPKLMKCLIELQLHFPNDIEKMGKKNILKHALMNLSLNDFLSEHYINTFMNHLSNHFSIPDLKTPGAFCIAFIQQTQNKKPSNNFDSAVPRTRDIDFNAIATKNNKQFLDNELAKKKSKGLEESAIQQNNDNELKKKKSIELEKSAIQQNNDNELKKKKSIELEESAIQQNNGSVSSTEIVDNVSTTLTVDPVVEECQTDIFNELTQSTYTFYLLRTAMLYKKFEKITNIHVMMYYKEIDTTIRPSCGMLYPYDHCLQTVQREIMDEADNKSYLDVGLDSLYSLYSYATPTASQSNEMIRMRACLGELYAYFPKEWTKIEILKHALKHLSLEDFGDKHYVKKYLNILPEYSTTPNLKETDRFCEDLIHQKQGVNFNSILSAVKKERDEYDIKKSAPVENSKEYIEEQLINSVEEIVNKIAKRRKAAFKKLKKEKVSEKTCIQDIHTQITDSDNYESVVNTIFKIMSYSEIETFHVREYCETIRSILTTVDYNMVMPDVYCAKTVNDYIDKLEAPPPESIVTTVGNASYNAVNAITTSVGLDTNAIASTVTTLPGSVATGASNALSTAYTTTSKMFGIPSGTPSAPSTEGPKTATASALSPEDLEKKKKEESKKKRETYIEMCKVEVYAIFNYSPKKTAKDILDEVYMNFTQNDLRENVLRYSREYMWKVIQSWTLKVVENNNQSNSNPDDPDFEGFINIADQFPLAAKFCKEFCKNN